MPEPIDTDGDGLGDYWEDRNGNRVFDTGESNPLDFDTDYDGRTDGQEYADGTDATSASSVSSVLLGYWRFNTNSWIGEQGQLPKAFTNLQSVASWSSNAVLINSNTVANLKYRDVETSLSANINCRNGTVRFWFKPDWNSSTTNSGTGPQSQGRLIELTERLEAAGRDEDGDLVWLEAPHHGRTAPAVEPQSHRGKSRLRTSLEKPPARELHTGAHRASA